MSAPARRRRPAKPTNTAEPETAVKATPAQTESPAGEPRKAAPRILSIDEVAALYEGEWVLMKVTAFEDGWPSQGEVLAHSPSREAMCKLRSELPPVSPGVKVTYYLFDAYRYIRTGAEMREALEEAWRTGAKGAWRRW